MSTAELLAQPKDVSNADRLTVIETATRLVREDLLAQPGSPRAEQDRQLRQAAEAVRDLYEPGGELTEWTSPDSEEILDDSIPG